MPDGYGAGYTCSASAKKYTSCKSGYYLNGTGAGNSCSTCSSLGYTSSANGNSNGAAACYKSCTKACTRQTCPSSAYSCSHGSTSTSGTQYYGGSCSAPSSTCSLTINSCKSGYYKNGNSCEKCPTGYTSDNGTTGGINSCYKSCTKSCTKYCSISGATWCAYNDKTTTGRQYYGGSCNAADPGYCPITNWSCSGGFYYVTGGCSSCKNISASDLSQSCSRSATSTELSNAHASAGTISGATQKCTGNHTSGPTGATSSSQCTGCSSWGTCSGGTVVASACQAGYYKNGNSCEKCPTGYTSDNGTTGGINSCYKSCTKSCTKYCSISGATWCAYNDKTTTGRQYYGGSCNAADPGYCPITNWSCSGGFYYVTGGCSSCKNISASDLSQSCSRSATSTELSNAHASAGTISGATQKCTGNHTSGPTGATSASQCTGCSSWGSCSGGTVVASACQAGYYKNGNSCEKCPTGYTSANGTTGGIGSCYINVSAGKYIATANSSTQSTCTAGYWNPAHTVYYGNTSSCNKCTGTTYSDTDGASSCKQCPTATEYAGIVRNYGYWTADGLHDTLSECRAYFVETSDEKGTFNNYSCAYCDGDYGVSDACGDACNAWSPLTSTCNASYYNPNIVGERNGKTFEELKSNLCVSVGAGNWSGAGATAPTQCPDGYRDGPAATSEAGCAKNCISQSIVGGVNTPVSDSVNYPASCTYTTVCDDGYNLTGTNTCSQLCTLGVTSLRTGNGVTIPLYSSALSTPSLNIGTGGGVCYGILESGAGTLNIQYDGKTYHAVD